MSISWRGPFASDGLPPEIRRYNPEIYQAEVDDGHLTVIVADEPDGWHLSISHRLSTVDPATGRPAAGRLPSYEELKAARYRFCPNAVCMAQIFPPREEFVNHHPTTLHLWEVPAQETT